MTSRSVTAAPQQDRRPERPSGWFPSGPNASCAGADTNPSATGRVSDCEMASNGVPDGAKGPGKRTCEHSCSIARYQMRLWSKSGAGSASSCWLWTGHVNENGYGYMTMFGAKRRVHRVAYEWTKGPIPEGLQLDHLCRNRRCVNPGHLEAVTAQENTRRALRDGPPRPRATHCRRGHSLKDGIARSDKPGRVRCRVCKNARNKEYARRKAAHQAATNPSAGGAR